MIVRRELVIIVLVGLVVMLGGMFVYNKVDSSISRRTARLKQLQAEVEGKQSKLRAGRATIRRLDAYRRMSLPSDEQLARSQYQAWLAEIVEVSGIADPQVKVISQVRLTSGATQLTCSVSGKANLEQFSRLLYEFYRVHTIHRIRRMPVKPITDTKLLDVSCIVEALIMPDAPDDVDFDASNFSAIGERPFEFYAEPILQRNMFSPANRPPELASVERQQAELGKSISIALRGRDPDALDQLSFDLGPSAPEDAEMDRQSGEFRWRPEALGVYEIPVVVRDDGWPPLEDQATLRIEVVEPRAEVRVAADAEPEFDHARFTYAVGSVQQNGRWQVWLKIRTSGEMLRLSVGDAVKIGSIDGTITHIERNEFALQNGEKTYNIRIGEPLVGAQVVREGGL